MMLWHVLFWNWVHSHCSLSKGMEMRYVSVLSYNVVILYCICIALLCVLISFSGLHSSVDIVISGS